MNTQARLILLLAKIHAAWLEVERLANELDDKELNEAVSLTKAMIIDTTQVVKETKHRLRVVE